MKFYEPKFFRAEEYVPPEVFTELGDRAITLMDERVLRTDDAIRQFFGCKVTINNWVWGGGRTFSGWRPDYSVVGAKWSQHKYGRASDKILAGISAETARREIIRNRKAFPFITVMEDGVPWLHTDCRCIVNDNIYLVKP